MLPLPLLLSNVFLFFIVRKYVNWGSNVEAYLLAFVLSLTNIICGFENKCEREIQQLCIVLISSTSKREEYMALFSLRACHSPCMGFKFKPLSTSVMQLRPTAIYYRQIERFQGVGQYVLALNVQAGYLNSFSPLCTWPEVWVIPSLGL